MGPATDEVVAFLDHRPLLPGHVLVMPKTHYETLGDLPGLIRLVDRLMPGGAAAMEGPSRRPFGMTGRRRSGGPRFSSDAGLLTSGKRFT